MTPTRKGDRPAGRGPGRPVGTDSGRTRDYLLRVAREVLAQRGVTRATIREIADRAGVNPALLHYYFGSKSGLHTALVTEVGKRIRTEIAGAGGREGAFRERLRALVHTYVATLASEPFLAQMLVHHLLIAERPADDELLSEIGAPLVEAIRELIEGGLASRELREIDPGFLIAVIAGSGLGAFLAAPILRPGPRTETVSRAWVEAWASSLTDLLLDGISQEPGGPKRPS
ncbi:MAG: TetR/AcrR family transcriptional regulator [Myxococcota bacterium]